MTEGLRPRPVQPVRGLVAVYRGFPLIQMKSDSVYKLTGTVTSEIDERCHLETDEGEMGRDTSDGMVGKKGQSLEHSMKGNAYSVRCDQRNESYFEVVPHRQKAFQL